VSSWVTAGAILFLRKAQALFFQIATQFLVDMGCLPRKHWCPQRSSAAIP